MKKIVACGLVLAMWGAVSTVCLASSSLEAVIGEYNQAKAVYNDFADACGRFVEQAKSEGLNETEIESFINGSIEPAKEHIQNMPGYCEQIWGKCRAIERSYIGMFKQDMDAFAAGLRNYPQSTVSEAERIQKEYDLSSEIAEYEKSLDEFFKDDPSSEFGKLKSLYSTGDADKDNLIFQVVFSTGECALDSLLNRIEFDRNVLNSQF